MLDVPWGSHDVGQWTPTVERELNRYIRSHMLCLGHEIKIRKDKQSHKFHRSY